jgi:hypothetical protein
MLSLKDIYEELHSLGVVGSGRSFGNFINRGQSYLSSSLSRHRRPSAEVLLALVQGINDCLDATIEAAALSKSDGDRSEYEHGIKGLKVLESRIWGEIWRRADGRSGYSAASNR